MFGDVGPALGCFLKNEIIEYQERKRVSEKNQNLWSEIADPISVPDLCGDTITAVRVQQRKKSTEIP